ncbi:MAG: hypothetical protein Q7S22_00390 [Candidatus Micrarchaeota archaeon]|nr:hypothetical protein [Candidatus Micrarchaeota archaeon]
MKLRINLVSIKGKYKHVESPVDKRRKELRGMFLTVKAEELVKTLFEGSVTVKEVAELVEDGPSIVVRSAINVLAQATEKGLDVSEKASSVLGLALHNEKSMDTAVSVLMGSLLAGEFTRRHRSIRLLLRGLGDARIRDAVTVLSNDIIHSDWYGQHLETNDRVFVQATESIAKLMAEIHASSKTA